MYTTQKILVRAQNALINARIDIKRSKIKYGDRKKGENEKSRDKHFHTGERGSNGRWPLYM